MARKQSKEFLANQELLTETWHEHGGPDGLRQHYIDVGVRQEHNRLVQIGKTILFFGWKLVEPFAVKFAGEKIIAFLDRQQENASDSTEKPKSTISD